MSPEGTEDDRQHAGDGCGEQGGASRHGVGTGIPERGWWGVMCYNVSVEVCAAGSCVHVSRSETRLWIGC
jgi:hypothetical protein